MKRYVMLDGLQMRGLQPAALLKVRHHTLSGMHAVEEQLKLLH